MSFTTGATDTGFLAKFEGIANSSGQLDVYWYDVQVEQGDTPSYRRPGPLPGKIFPIAFAGIPAADSSYFNSGQISGRHFAGGNPTDFSPFVDSSGLTLFARHATIVQTGSNRATAAIDSGNIIVPAGIDFTRSYSNKILDNIGDGTSYKRVGAGAFATSTKFVHSAMSDGTQAAVDTSGNLLASDLPSQTVHQTTGTYAGWELITGSHLTGASCNENNGANPHAGWLWEEWNGLSPSTSIGYGPAFYDSAGTGMITADFFSAAGVLYATQGTGAVITNVGTLSANTANDGKPHTFRLGFIYVSGVSPTFIFRVVAYIDGTKVFDGNITSSFSNFVTFAGFRGDSGSSIYIRDFKWWVGVDSHEKMPASITGNFDINGQARSSTMLNNQGSLLNVSGTPTVTYTVTSSQITVSIPATTYTRTDRTTVTVPSYSHPWGGLSPSVTYDFDVWYDAVANVFNSQIYGAAGPTNAQLLSDCYCDGRVVINAALSVTTQTSGGTGGTGGTKPPPPGGGSCPAAWQLMLTKERGLLRADEIDLGMHIAGPNGTWVEVTEATKLRAPIWTYVLTDGAIEESFDVNDTHAIMDTHGEWRKVRDLKPGDKLKGENTELTVVYANYVMDDWYVALEVEGHIYSMGKATIHNPITF
jgi:hypothetical protein